MKTKESDQVEAPTGATVADKPSAAVSGYRRQALLHYRKPLKEAYFHTCAVCGFGIQAVLEVAHLGQDRKDNTIENLAILCPNCHKMHDIGLIPREVVILLRDQKAAVNWGPRVKEAGPKAAATRKANALKIKKSEAGTKAWATKQAKAKLPAQ